MHEIEDTIPIIPAQMKAMLILIGLSSLLGLNFHFDNLFEQN